MSTSALNTGMIDWHFLKRLILISVPISLQTMMFSSRSLVDIMMMGQLGENDVAAIGIAGKALFVATILIFGAMTGGSMLVSQYWGAGDNAGFRQKTALTLTLTNMAAAISAFSFWFFAEHIIGFATSSPEIIELGAVYLKITGVSLFCVACGSSMAAALRAMHKPGISTFFSALGISLNVFLNWMLIFGNLGAPALGIEGAAIATLISGVTEVTMLFSYLYLKKHPVAFSFDDWKMSLTWKAVSRFLSLSLPTAFNFFIWSSGLFVYHAIIGRVSDTGLAAIAVMTPIESISLSFMIGTSNAAAVLIGNQLGANNNEQAYQQAWLVGAFNVGIAVIIAAIMLMLQGPILGLFSALTPETLEITRHFYWIMAGLILIKSIPMAMIIGVLRAGGDVRYCLYQDVTAQWLIGIPIVFTAAILLELPVQAVYALFATEEIVKWVGSIRRVKSRVWLNNLVSE